MVKKLTKHGNSLALIIDRSILELLNIGPDTPLSVRTDGQRLIIGAATADEASEAFRKSLKNVNARFAPALKRLAE
jgi:antitoxin MazE